MEITITAEHWERARHAPIPSAPEPLRDYCNPLVEALQERFREEAEFYPDIGVVFVGGRELELPEETAAFIRPFGTSRPQPQLPATVKLTVRKRKEHNIVYRALHRAGVPDAGHIAVEMNQALSQYPEFRTNEAQARLVRRRLYQLLLASMPEEQVDRIPPIAIKLMKRLLRCT